MSELYEVTIKCKTPPPSNHKWEYIGYGDIARLEFYLTSDSIVECVGMGHGLSKGHRFKLVRTHHECGIPVELPYFPFYKVSDDKSSFSYKYHTLDEIIDEGFGIGKVYYAFDDMTRTWTEVSYDLIKPTGYEHFFVETHTRKFEITKTGTYKTRDGNIALVTYISDDHNDFPIGGIVNNRTNCLWTSVGSALLSNTKHHYDLVEFISDDYLKSL